MGQRKEGMLRSVFAPRPNGKPNSEGFVKSGYLSSFSVPYFDANLTRLRISTTT